MARSRLPHRLRVEVSSWTCDPQSFHDIHEKGFCVYEQDTKCLWFTSYNDGRRQLVREAILELQWQVAGLSFSHWTDHGDIVVKYDDSKYELEEVVQIVCAAADKASRAFAIN